MSLLSALAIAFLATTAPLAASADDTPRVFVPCAVTLTGTAVLDGTLVGTSIDDSGCDPSEGFCWYRDAALASDYRVAEDPRRYLITGADVGKRISVLPGRIPCPDLGSVTTPVSTSDIIVTAHFRVPALTISGEPRIGAYVKATLAKKLRVPKQTDVRWAWFADGRPISGSTGPRLRVPVEAAGKQLSVSLTVTSPGYLSTTAAATPVFVPTLLLRRGTVRVTGTARVGHTLRASSPGWSIRVSKTYRWYAAGHALARATQPTLRLTTKMRGSHIRVVVTVTRPGYVTLTARSAATASVRRP